MSLLPAFASIEHETSHRSVRSVDRRCGSRFYRRHPATVDITRDGLRVVLDPGAPPCADPAGMARQPEAENYNSHSDGFVFRAPFRRCTLRAYSNCKRDSYSGFLNKMKQRLQGRNPMRSHSQLLRNMLRQQSITPCVWEAQRTPFFPAT